MPRFHFNMTDGEARPDLEGSELANLDDAKLAATQYLSESLHNNPSRLWDTGDLTVTVTDDVGLSIFTKNLSATLSPTLSAGGPRSRA